MILNNRVFRLVYLLRNCIPTTYLCTLTFKRERQPAHGTQNSGDQSAFVLWQNHSYTFNVNVLLKIQQQITCISQESLLQQLNAWKPTTWTYKKFHTNSVHSAQKSSWSPALQKRHSKMFLLAICVSAQNKLHMQSLFCHSHSKHFTILGQ